jgi:hypothetical protein
MTTLTIVPALDGMEDVGPCFITGGKAVHDAFGLQVAEKLSITAVS